MITVFVTHQFIFLFINEFVVFIFTDCSNSFIEIGLPASGVSSYKSSNAFQGPLFFCNPVGIL